MLQVRIKLTTPLTGIDVESSITGIQGRGRPRLALANALMARLRRIRRLKVVQAGDASERSGEPDPDRCGLRHRFVNVLHASERAVRAS